MTDDEKLRSELLAKAQKLDTELHHSYRKNGYQLSKEDIESLDELIQRALHVGSPDALRQFAAIRTAYEVHGKVSYEQMKLLREVSDVFSNYRI